MIKHPKKTYAPRVKKLTLSLSAFKGIDFGAEVRRTLPADFAAKIYNFGFSNGRLVRCPHLGTAERRVEGVSFNMTLPHFPVERVFGFHIPNQNSALGQSNFLIAVSRTGQVFTHNLAATAIHAWVLHPSATLSGMISTPGATRITGAQIRNKNGADVFLLGSANNALMSFNGVTFRTVTGAPRVAHMAVYGERVYVVRPDDLYTLWFSDDLDPFNWNTSLNEGGFISLQREDGEIIGLVSFDSHLYIIRERGIWRLSGFSDQTQFSLTKMYVSAGNILRDTVAVAEDAILFMTPHGLHRFDGFSVTRPHPHISEFMKSVDPMMSSACFNNGVYYYGCYKDYGDGLDGRFNHAGMQLNPNFLPNPFNTVLCVSTVTGEVCVIRGADCRALTSINLPVFSAACYISPLHTHRLMTIDAGRNFPVRAVPRFWCSPELDFGAPQHKKMLKKINFTTSKPLELHVVADGKNHVFKTPVSSLNISGRIFRIAFFCEDAEPDILAPTVEADVLVSTM